MEFLKQHEKDIEEFMVLPEVEQISRKTKKIPPTVLPSPPPPVFGAPKGPLPKFKIKSMGEPKVSPLSTSNDSGDGSDDSSDDDMGLFDEMKIFSRNSPSVAVKNNKKKKRKKTLKWKTSSGHTPNIDGGIPGLDRESTLKRMVSEMDSNASGLDEFSKDGVFNRTLTHSINLLTLSFNQYLEILSSEIMEFVSLVVGTVGDTKTGEAIEAESFIKTFPYGFLVNESEKKNKINLPIIKEYESLLKTLDNVKSTENTIGGSGSSNGSGSKTNNRKSERIGQSLQQQQQQHQHQQQGQKTNSDLSRSKAKKVYISHAIRKIFRRASEKIKLGPIHHIDFISTEIMRFGEQLKTQMPYRHRGIIMPYVKSLSKIVNGKLMKIISDSLALSDSRMKRHMHELANAKAIQIGLHIIDVPNVEKHLKTLEKSYNHFDYDDKIKIDNVIDSATMSLDHRHNVMAMYRDVLKVMNNNSTTATEKMVKRSYSTYNDNGENNSDISVKSKRMRRNHNYRDHYDDTGDGDDDDDDTDGGGGGSTLIGDKIDDLHNLLNSKATKKMPSIFKTFRKPLITGETMENMQRAFSEKLEPILNSLFNTHVMSDAKEVVRMNPFLLGDLILKDAIKAPITIGLNDVIRISRIGSLRLNDVIKVRKIGGSNTNDKIETPMDTVALFGDEPTDNRSVVYTFASLVSAKMRALRSIAKTGVSKSYISFSGQRTLTREYNIILLKFKQLVRRNGVVMFSNWRPVGGSATTRRRRNLFNLNGDGSGSSNITTTGVFGNVTVKSSDLSPLILKLVEIEKKKQLALSLL